MCKSALQLLIIPVLQAGVSPVVKLCSWSSSESVHVCMLFEWLQSEDVCNRQHAALPQVGRDKKTATALLLYRMPAIAFKPEKASSR